MVNLRRDIRRKIQPPILDRARDIRLQPASVLQPSVLAKTFNRSQEIPGMFGPSALLQEIQQALCDSAVVLAVVFHGYV